MFGALNCAPTELVLLARTPCIDGTVACKCENVIRTACKLFNLFQSFHQHRPVFDSDDLPFLPSKSNHSFISLREEVNNVSKTSGTHNHTLNVPQPYTRPSSVNANVILSPAASCVKTVPSGKTDMSIAVGVASLGLIPVSLSSSESPSLFSSSMSRVGASQVTSLPNAPSSFTPHVNILLSYVKAAQCEPPTAMCTTPTVSAARCGF